MDPLKKHLEVQKDVLNERHEHIARKKRIANLPLSTFDNNPVYRILFIWEAEAYINNINKQLDAAFLN
jgi:hypothetical protein